MKTLISLFFQKKKATLRNLFKKPASFIMTLVIVVMYGSMLIPLFLTGGKEAMDSDLYNQLAFIIVGLLGVIILMMFMQKRMALFFLEDSYYLFIGPFKEKQIIAYLLFDAVLTSFLVGLISIFPAALMSAMKVIPWINILGIVLVGFMMMFITTLLITIPYLKSLINGKASKLRMRLGIALLLLILGVVAYSIFESDFNIKKGLLNLLSSDAFNYIPVIGWGKYAMASWFAKDLIGILLGMGSLALLSLILSYLLVNTKGYFFEQAMIDSADFTDYYNKMRSVKGMTNNENLKAHDVNLKFRSGEFAIFSKNLLIMLKTRSLIRFQDIIIIAAIIGFSVYIEVGILGYVVVVLLYMFSTIASSSLSEDLRHHYVYLIPGSSLKKLLATVWIPMIKPSVLCVVGIVIAGLAFFNTPILDIVLFSLLSVSFIVIFTVSNIVGGTCYACRNVKDN